MRYLLYLITEIRWGIRYIECTRVCSSLTYNNTVAVKQCAFNFNAFAFMMMLLAFYPFSLAYNNRPFFDGQECIVLNLKIDVGNVRATYDFILPLISVIFVVFFCHSCSHFACLYSVTFSLVQKIKK